MSMKATILDEVKLQVKAVFLQCDSKTVINYLNNEKTNFSVFIAHQVNEIRNSSKTEEKFYLPTSQNVADDLTRYKGFDNLTYRSKWCVGSDSFHKEVTPDIFSINSITRSGYKGGGDDAAGPSPPFFRLSKF